MPAGERPSVGDLDGAPDIPSMTDNSSFDGSSPMSRSFSEVDDGDLAAALNLRIGQIASSTAPYESEVTEEEVRHPLSGGF